MKKKEKKTKYILNGWILWYVIYLNCAVIYDKKYWKQPVSKILRKPWSKFLCIWLIVALQNWTYKIIWTKCLKCTLLSPYSMISVSGTSRKICCRLSMDNTLRNISVDEHKQTLNYAYEVFFSNLRKILFWLRRAEHMT